MCLLCVMCYVLCLLSCALVCLGHGESDPSSALHSKDSSDHNFGDSRLSGVFQCQSQLTARFLPIGMLYNTRSELCTCWCLERKIDPRALKEVSQVNAMSTH